MVDNKDIKNTCAICRKPIEGNKHNPWPFDDDVLRPHCCDTCYNKDVKNAQEALVKLFSDY
jgi:endogenous inhibitor of DNA gyrase (YacG/DUF329 family)